MSTVPAPALSASTHAAPDQAATLICLPTLTGEAFDATLDHLRRAFPLQPIIVATPDPVPTRSSSDESQIRILNYTSSSSPHGAWVPTAADYLNAWTLAREHHPQAVLLLGAEAASVSPDTLRRLVSGVFDQQDLVLPRYPVGPRDALVNSAILYPLTRALFSQHVRFPLPIDAALSPRMAERLATTAQRLTSTNQADAFVWPVAEAAVAGFSVRDVAGDQRTLPLPGAIDLNSLLSNVAGSLFADIEARASFWQRARLATTAPRVPTYATRSTAADANPLDLAPMIDSFRNAYTNLRELWSLVLPPNSLLNLKKLSLTPPETFRMPDALWARTVYDFVLAYRLRTINRTHLLGAMTPLYLAWVASHLRMVDGDATLAEQHIEAVATAFESDKPYLVARWRWPDRFNP